MATWDDVRAECDKLNEWFKENAVLPRIYDDPVGFGMAVRERDNFVASPNDAFNVYMMQDNPDDAFKSIRGASRLVRGTDGKVVVRHMARVGHETDFKMSMERFTFVLRLAILWPRD